MLMFQANGITLNYWLQQFRTEKTRLFEDQIFRGSLILWLYFRGKQDPTLQSTFMS